MEFTHTEHNVEVSKIKRGVYAVERDDGRSFRVDRKSTPGDKWVIFSTDEHDPGYSLGRADTKRCCIFDIKNEYLRW